MAYRLAPVTSGSIRDAPPPCVECVFWQARDGRTTDKERWAERVEDAWGAWGTLYVAEQDRVLGFIQFGPSQFFQRARVLPAGPPSGDAVLITCAYLVDPSAPWVIQSLFLSVIGEVRDRGVKAIETFGYRYPEGTNAYDRFGAPDDLPERLPRRLRLQPDPLGRSRRSRPPGARRPAAGRGGTREVVLRKVKEAFTPAPVPQRPMSG